MPFTILEKPLCYSTFVTKDDSSSSLKRCAKCRCAWYISLEEQRVNWPIHKQVCQPPDYEMVSKLTKPQCLMIIRKSIQKCDHNTAAIFDRFFDLMQKDSDVGNDQNNNADYGETLHSLTRLSSPAGHQSDNLESYYLHAWACPGMPQLLYYTDLKSATLRKMMKNFPEGRPSFEDENEACDFDMEYETDCDMSGEDVAWFIIGFLVRSSVWGRIALTSLHDGRGTLRNTFYATAAKKRLTQIFSNKTLRDCAKKACYPIPGLMLNIAENNKQELLQLLNEGVGPAVIEWADQEYGENTLDIMSTLDMGGLSDDIKFDLLEVCCNIFCKHGPTPWSSTDESKGEQLVQLCAMIAARLLSTSSNVVDLLKKGKERRPESSEPQWIDTGRDQKRIVLAFLYENVLAGGVTKEVDFIKLFKQFGSLETWNRIKYAQEVLHENTMIWYTKKARELCELTEKLKKRKADK